MHTGVSGCGHFLVKSDEEGIDVAKRYLSYFPSHWQEAPPVAPPAEPASAEFSIPEDENKPFDINEVIDVLVDEGSFLEVHKRWAKELVVGYARLDGRVVGIVANQPKQKGGVLFVDSSDKAARFIWTCNAFNVPLLFLADVPGFMIGTQVERQGIIRAGAKMISAVSEATVPKISVILRKAYGAGLYAMAGPAFDPDACIALPSAKIAVMGPQAAINAVFYNQVQAIEDEAEREALRREAPARVQGRDRHPAPGLGDGGRRGDSARGPAHGAGPALRAVRRPCTGVAGEAQRGHAGLEGGADLGVQSPGELGAEPVGALQGLRRRPRAPSQPTLIAGRPRAIAAAALVGLRSTRDRAA